MQAFTSNLIAVVLLSHAVLGCCWHNAQRLALADQQQSTIAPACCQHEHSGDHRDSHPGTPCDCRWECHAVCVYVPEESGLESSLAAFNAELVGVVAEPAVGDPSDCNVVHWIGDDPASGAPAERLYLLHQILLI
jgi:hypothetical protein